jgi:hypothetical protein
MINPTTKAEVLAHMRSEHQAFLDVLSSIPEERMYETALYNAWSIKDFLAHVGWWAQVGADRIAMTRRGETPPPIDDYDLVNAEILERFRSISLDEAQALEHQGFAALEIQTEELSEEDIFQVHMGWIKGPTYGHYEEHMDDVKAWMQQNGLK